MPTYMVNDDDLLDLNEQVHKALFAERAASFVFESFGQFQVRKVAELVIAYGCTKKEAEECVSHLSPHADNWWKTSTKMIEHGGTPPQWWVNLISGRGKYTRWESFLKHRPDVFDRLHAAGLSLFWPRSEMEQKT